MDQHVDPTRDQFDAFKVLPRNAPVQMLNLLRFRDEASYPADHELAGTALTGAAAYARYGEQSGPIFRRVGGSILWAGRPQVVLIGPADERWDAAFLASYPTAAAFLEMVTDADYRLAVVHRQAGVATSRLVRLSPERAGEAFG